MLSSGRRRAGLSRCHDDLLASEINQTQRLAAWSRLSAATLRPSAAPGLAEAPARGACAPSGRRA
eukprot:4212353-Prymnesium_polylepis.1